MVTKKQIDGQTYRQSNSQSRQTDIGKDRQTF